MSFGPKPCDTTIPTVFTRVAGYRSSGALAGAELQGHHIGAEALGLHSGAEDLGLHSGAEDLGRLIRAGGTSVVQGLDREDRGAKRRLGMKIRK